MNSRNSSSIHTTQQPINEFLFLQNKQASIEFQPKQRNTYTGVENCRGKTRETRSERIDERAVSTRHRTEEEAKEKKKRGTNRRAMGDGSSKAKSHRASDPILAQELPNMYPSPLCRPSGSNRVPRRELSRSSPGYSNFRPQFLPLILARRGSFRFFPLRIMLPSRSVFMEISIVIASFSIQSRKVKLRRPIAGYVNFRFSMIKGEFSGENLIK